MIQWCVAKQKKGHIVKLWGIGDYFETFSPSERAALQAGKSGYGLHETTKEKLDQWVQGEADAVYKILKPMTGNFICLLTGHHKHLWFVPKGKKEGMTTDEYLCQKLGCEYAGDLVQIQLLINGLRFKIFAAHGYGSARTIGARMAKRIRMRDVVSDANWYVMGHDDEKMVVPTETIVTNDHGEVSYLKQYFSGSGSFQRSYTMGKADAGYIEQGLYPPASLGVVIGTVMLREKNGKPALDYHIST